MSTVNAAPVRSRAATRAVLFDLDGTFADTAADMAAALNRLLASRRRAAVAAASVRPYVSQGARGMLRAGFGIGPEDASFAELRAAFLDEYAREVCVQSAPFPGVSELLAHLEKAEIAWGIVTNKAARFTLPLLAAMGVEGRAACVVCGDTCERAKPYPDSLLHAARLIGADPGACIYVGDDERDMQAANAAGMRGIVALYGYLGTGTPPDRWSASAMVAAPLELIALM